MSILDEIRRILREDKAKSVDDAAFVERLEKLGAQMQGIVNIKPDVEIDAKEAEKHIIERQPSAAIGPGAGI